MVLDLYEITGLIGVFLTLLAYLLLNMEKLRQNSFSYLFSNAIGSIMIMVSFIKHWNIPSFTVELSWLLISVYGLIRVYSKKIQASNRSKVRLN